MKFQAAITLDKPICTCGEQAKIIWRLQRYGRDVYHVFWCKTCKTTSEPERHELVEWSVDIDNEDVAAVSKKKQRTEHATDENVITPAA